MKTEQRTFRVHSNLLFDVIKRQAGSLAQACAEAVTNSVDAGATAVYVTVDPTTVTVTDDGRGFESRQQVETNFEVFGQPHSEDEHKTFGVFRMGRGQCFAYGSNVWRSGHFVMEVNIRDLGLDYELSEVAGRHNGCTVAITLYNRLTLYEVEQLVRTLERCLHWLATPVYVNDRQVSKDPAAQPKDFWTHVTDEAYVKLTDSDNTWNVVDVYNQGVFVTTISGQWDKNALAVSRKQLQLNFARTDVMDSCPEWAKIRPLVFVERTKDAKKKKSPGNKLDDMGRNDYARQVIDGELGLAEYRNLRLIQDVTGRHWSFNMLKQVQGEYGYTLTSAALKGPKGSQVFKNKVAFVVSHKTLSRFECTGPGELAEKLHTTWPALGLRGVTFEEVYKDAYVRVNMIDVADYSDLQKAMAFVLTARGIEFLQAVYTASKVGGEVRKVVFGNSPGPRHWTDGKGYIGLDWEWVKGVGLGPAGWFKLCAAVAHEYCHADNSIAQHTHDPDFYRVFHDSVGGLGAYVVGCLRSFVNWCHHYGLHADQVGAAEDGVGQMNEADTMAGQLLGG